MRTPFGVFRNDGDDGDDGDRNDGDDGDYGNSSGIAGYSGARSNSLLAQALWRTRGDLTNGLPGTATDGFTWKEALARENIFGRWSRDVRAHLYSFELLSGLHFDGDEKGKEAALVSFTVKKGGEVDIPKRLVALKRPDFDENRERLKEELGKVMRKAELRAERMPEILAQVYVPYPFFAMVLNLQPGRHRYTYELMSTVFRFSSTVVMQFKNHLRVRRPADRSALVQPVLLTPAHGSFPAGHATQCFFVATVLKTLVGNALGADVGKQLDALAERIADNRVIAGLHYEPDNEAGTRLGIALASYFMERAKVSHSALGWLCTRASEEWIEPDARYARGPGGGS